MFGSYGSYSSMCAASAPMDITSRSLSAHDSTCAFPSWPRRSSLSESDREERPTSYLSDDDLFLSDPFDDDTRSVSSTGSSSSPRTASPPHVITDAELLEMERERAAMQREFVRGIVSEKERRRAAARKQRKSSPSSKKSPKSKLSSMAPIAE
ncbi:hypothetical protein QQZ08_012463 [Neonectria magnoliae]|uniref:Uncharacterized protein n=1 Tax=Neonectria magnoliae TaxID=2732573 RepID=A0ABR1H1W0_9HYPO